MPDTQRTLYGFVLGWGLAVAGYHLRAQSLAVELVAVLTCLVVCEGCGAGQTKAVRGRMLCTKHPARVGLVSIHVLSRYSEKQRLSGYPVGRNCMESSTEDMMITRRYDECSSSARSWTPYTLEKTAGQGNGRLILELVKPLNAKCCKTTRPR